MCSVSEPSVRSNLPADLVLYHAAQAQPYFISSKTKVVRMLCDASLEGHLHGSSSRHRHRSNQKHVADAAVLKLHLPRQIRSDLDGVGISHHRKALRFFCFFLARCLPAVCSRC